MIRPSYDVVIAGGGPVGCVAAIAFARRGASVLLVEADPKVSTRFAGEWLHPPGVAVLDRLRASRLEHAHARTGYGFVIVPDDGTAAIEMPYAQGTALAAEHAGIVASLRAVVQSISHVDWLPNARVKDIDGHVVRIERKERGAVDVRTERLVGADGRASTVREKLGIPDHGTLLSYMAAVELHGVTLPSEGFGHVVLGGPGPALFYRIADDVVRGCLDVPISFGAGARAPSFIWDAFAPVLPPSMKPAFRAAIEKGLAGWAANRFRPRTDFGREAAPGRAQVALIGDAVGHVHPMTANGMTLGFLDAEALVNASSIAEYAEARRAYVPEVLSNALYHCFRREDASAVQLRRAMFETLRKDEGERRRTMSILAAQDLRKRTFGSAFVRMAGRALGDTAGSSMKQGTLDRLPRDLAGLASWMQWPAAMLVPSRVRERYRADSSPFHPIPALAALLQVDVSTPPTDAPSDRRADTEVALEPVLAKGSDALVVELESIARRMASLPDRAIAGPGVRMMRAITARSMRPALAARMTIGRRRLATEGFARLVEAGPIETETLAGLLILLLDGAAWAETPIAGLGDAVRMLLTIERAGGGFSASTGTERADLFSTMLACRALDVVIRRRPDATDADLEAVLSRAATFLRSRQSEDGSFGTVLDTAHAMEALVAAEANPGDPAMRRATKWLTARASDDGLFDDGDGSDAIAITSAVLSALSRASVPAEPLRQAAARALVAIAERDPLPWTTTAEIVEALAAYEAHRAGRPVSVRQRRARNDAPPSKAIEPVLRIDQADWAFCKDALEQVSRTFSRPIAMLPGRLEVAVTLGYLLCRIADTIEDHPNVGGDVRGGLFRIFLDILERDGDPQSLSTGFEMIVGDDAELRLARAMPTVMRVFRAQAPSTIAISTRWVAEMARGMDLYTCRKPQDDGLYALYTVSDLDRYCYYVAGTVGHMLTELFVDEMRAGGMDERTAVELERKLRQDAESFAEGLQLVNILKDVTDDRARNVSFIPRTSAGAVGLELNDLVLPEHRRRAHAAVGPLFDLAREKLDGALRYALALPKTEIGIRLFCLLPLWMAARTLVVARGNDAMFVAGEPVKIRRDEVEALIAECMTHVADDAALEKRYAALYREDPLADRRRTA
jgi:phytoene/squalene synthetase/2-polyprenyl-6-methoxyphenol hydroxylase-like FAD-dependent oxidoreductase